MASFTQAITTSQFIMIPVLSLKEFIGYEMSLVAEVEAVLAERDGNVFHVCTIVPNSTPEVRVRIFEREQVIIEGFEEYEFDFDIIERMKSA